MDDIILGQGSGSSKKRAQQNAAKDALQKMVKNVWMRQPMQVLHLSRMKNMISTRLSNAAMKQQMMLQSH